MTMNTLKYFLIISSILHTAAAIIGIQSWTSTSAGTTITRFTIAGRAYAFFFAVIFSALAYGIHKRVLISWKFGFLLLMSVYLTATLQAVIRLYNNAHVVTFSAFWLPATASGIGFTIITLYFAIWWYRQRRYFIR
jgi:hypothetical protein